MKHKTINIIGAGIAGLAAGCYAQMNGYQTQIFEMHDKPGGLCTSWKRKGYIIDGCLHCLNGSGSSSPLHVILRELGGIKGRRVINYEELICFEGKGNKIFSVYTDIDRLEKHLKELSPQDEDTINDFIEALRICSTLDLPIEREPQLYGMIDGIKMLVKMAPYFKMMKKWKKVSIQDFAERFKDPFLREVFPYIFRFPELSIMCVFFSLGWLSKKASGFLEGGSLKLSKAIEQRYLDLGGKIQYCSPVSKILVRNNHAIGIELVNGNEHYSDLVISAADGHATIFDMLDSKYINNKIKGYYDKLPIYPPQIMVAFGVNRTFNEVPHLIFYPLKQPIIIADKEEKYIIINIYNYDPTLAPLGKTVMSVKFSSNYEYWKVFENAREQYQQEKRKIADQILVLLDQRFPGLANQVEMCDVATPLTWKHKTGNWQGSFEGWLATKDSFGLLIDKTLPRLSNFYMCGQWVAPGGSVALVGTTARSLIHIICKRDKKKFITQDPLT